MTLNLIVYLLYNLSYDAVEALNADNADKTAWLKKQVGTILTDLNAALEDTSF